MVEDAFAEATLRLAPPVQVVFLTSPGKQSTCEQVIPDLEFLVITFKTGDWTRPVQIRAGQMMSCSTGLSVPCAAEVEDGSSTPSQQGLLQNVAYGYFSTSMLFILALLTWFISFHLKYSIKSQKLEDNLCWRNVWKHKGNFVPVGPSSRYEMQIFKAKAWLRSWRERKPRLCMHNWASQRKQNTFFKQYIIKVLKARCISCELRELDSIMPKHTR